MVFKMTMFTTLAIFMALPFASQAATIAWDRAYDARDASLATVACSDGKNGLITRGFTTFGSLPKFPFIGATDSIQGYNSANCGSCWEITYVEGPRGRNRTINMLGVDATEKGVVLSLGAANALTGGHAEHLGRFNGTVKRLSAAACGL